MLRNTAKASLIAGLTLVLGACSLLPAAKPVQSWTLVPEAKVISDSGSEDAFSDLRILRPQTQDLLSGSYMLVVPEGQPVSVYQGARWGASIPTLWRDYLVGSLQQDSRFSHISGDEVRVAARYELVSRLDAFQSEYRNGQPVAVIRGYLQLVEVNSRRILAERPLAVTQPAQGKDVAAVVDAFSVLMAATAADVSQWLLEVPR
ncbi:ABC-type transport auxiliary lipoprotein family protein [Marinobacterium sediminicola]|uniref:Cholesterol transport system auxiliary component n=1 Tax=Marinobacterium sediminicola TaxID=518898 RepID=A0ABY1S165_9GAMM|nr:ABC-type transport auxiliary lipoprotein family protein [Marinobacterium sediminicola]ULG69844.1 ABC-type transport auxiliary lipoprotein family protein [Marinobacterium sediminicola]SMR75341.1 cholesterol transport system auxiliary component [Marinobacterium sediminicola]